MGEKIPSSCTVTVVVEPGAEDQVRGYAEEEAVNGWMCQYRSSNLGTAWGMNGDLHDDEPCEETPMLAIAVFAFIIVVILLV